MASIIVAQVIIACVTVAILWQISRRKRPNAPWRIWRLVAVVFFLVSNWRAYALATDAPWLGVAIPLFGLLTGAVLSVLIWTFGLRRTRPL